MVVPGRPRVDAGKTSSPDIVQRNSETAVSPAFSNQSLLPCQHQQLCVRRQNFTNGILELPPGFNTPAHFLDQMLGNVLDVFPAVSHKGQRPDQVPLALGTVTICLATAQMLLGEGAG